MATVHPPRPAPPPQFALPRSRADAGDDSDGESVAESCPFRAATDGHGLILGGACGDEEVEEEEEDDDDGCSSCVEGDGRHHLQLQEYGDGDDGGEPETIVEGGVWWTQLAAAAAAAAARDRELPQRPREAEAVAEDPKSATARQEEDRKFWEDCLASGYP
ncbi:hypothetical protein GUJ93_ZPchr0007g5318 [Zizania palustris]|uniref:Uncharacterized protein n=1 Tax=Zizania palustris TaxID=103762 RepID=A0A8J5W4U7_ZIZPA|nr:hypothetical protein GUJ93_ZPchr0007g5318 [Zizania palustris]